MEDKSVKLWLVFFLNKKTWVTISSISLGIFYLNLLWRSTGDIDLLTTDLLFCGAIFYLLWQKRKSLVLRSDLFSAFLGLLLLTVTLVKSINLFGFEGTLIPLIPLGFAISMALVSSGIRGIFLYRVEIFFAWFLFFPTGVIGHFIDGLIKITVLNAKLASYLLYYVGFNVTTQSNQVFLNLPELGQFKAIVDYPCAGVPMILLMLKISLLTIASVALSKTYKILMPLISVAIGFILGVIRVCVLTLLIPEPAKFDYWHGSSGDQIFSTLAILIFAGFAYWLLENNNSAVANSETLQPQSLSLTIQDEEATDSDYNQPRATIND